MFSLSREHPKSKENVINVKKIDAVGYCYTERDIRLQYKDGRGSAKRRLYRSTHSFLSIYYLPSPAVGAGMSGEEGRRGPFSLGACFPLGERRQAIHENINEQSREIPEFIGSYPSSKQKNENIQ